MQLFKQFIYHTSFNYISNYNNELPHLSCAIRPETLQ